MGHFLENILQRVENWVSDNSLLTDGCDVVVAISGGSDSIFTLWAMQQLAQAHRMKVSAIHINHLLRGNESDEDEQFVRQLCRRWKVPLVVHRVDVRSQAQRMKIGIEEAARKIRYQIFNDEARNKNCSIALGHTADDIVETMLLNLIRGSGVRGMAGISPKKKGIIRPILPIWRDEAQKALQQKNIKWREDSSNYDRRFLRNRIRLDLIPQMKQLFGDDVVGHIHSASQMLYRTRLALEDCFRMRYQQTFIAGCDGILLYRADLALSDSFTFGELLRQALPQLGIGLKRFSLSRVERIFNTISHTFGEKHCPIYAGTFAVRAENWLLIADHIPMQLDRITLPIGRPVELSSDLGTLKAEISAPPNKLVAGDRLTAYLSYTGEPIVIKPYREGFLFHPLGSVSMKLSSFLKKRRIPRVFRRALPLVFIGSRLAWVAGVEISEQFKITERTQKILRIEWSGNFPEIVVATTILSARK